MANVFKVKQSSVSSRAPTTSQLALGELAINTTDGKLYFKKNVAGTESIVDVTASAGATNIAQGTRTGTSVPITSSTGTGATLAAVDASNAGVMIAADKVKLDAISGTNTGDETLATIKTKLGISTLSGSNTGDQVLPTLASLGAQAAGTYASGSGSATGTNTGDQVIPVASSTAPAALGVAAVGVGTTFARADHVHLVPTLATLGAQAAGTYATGSGSATGTNTGDQVIPSTLPASDVYAWAKAAAKPSYTASEVGLGSVNNTSDASKSVSYAATAGSAPASGGTSAACSGNAATATNATNLGGYPPSQSSGAYNIVQRDVNGYVFNNYFNTTSGGAERNASGMGYFAGFNSSDTYIRSYTPAAVATAISGQTMNINGSSTSCSGNAATVTNGINTSNVASFSVKRTGNIGNADLNSATYYTGSQVLGYNTATNMPGASYATMLSLNERGDTCMQLVVDYSSGYLFSRGIYTGGGTYSPWRTCLNDANYNSYSPTLTGGNASGTWGINVTGSSTSCSGNAASASTASTVSNGNSSQNGDGWWRSSGNAGWYSTSYGVGIWATEAGNVRTYGGASFIAAGNVTAYSDERLKTNWRDMPVDFIERLAKIKNGTYDRTDDCAAKTQDGVSAQSLQPLMPNSIQTDSDGILSIAYGSAAMVSAVQLAKQVVEQHARIAKLESLINKLVGDLP